MIARRCLDQTDLRGLHPEVKQSGDWARYRAWKKRIGNWGSETGRIFHLSDEDYSQMRSVADEDHWQEFVGRTGGELVAPLITRQKVQNADFMFRHDRVVIELKVLETEFLNAPSVAKKIEDAFDRNPNGDPNDLTGPLGRELFNILRAPLQRIIKKANRQIRETKQELGLAGWRGIIVMVNDGFRALSPDLVMRLCSDILAGESYSSADAFIYQTNHYIEVPESPYALLLWAPLYAENTGQDLVEFVNDLGRQWRKYAEDVDGPFDYNEEQVSMDLSRSAVVAGPTRRWKTEGH